MAVAEQKTSPQASPEQAPQTWYGIVQQSLASVALNRAQIHIPSPLSFDRERPSQWYANDDAFIKTTLSKLSGGNVGFGEECTDFHAGGKTARHLESKAAISGKVLTRADREIHVIPRRRIIK